MMIALVLCIFLHIVSSLHISIDGNKGNDSIACIKGESSCQSLTYIADTINVSANLKIEVISSSLNLQGSVIFTGINGLTLNGKGANIICNKTSPSNESGIVFHNCIKIWLKGFNIKYCGLHQQKQKYCGLQAILFYNCSNFTVSSVNFTSSNGAGLVLYNSWGVNAIWQSIFKNNSLLQKIKKCPSLTGGGGGLQITQYQNSATTLLVSSCQFINNSAATAGGGIYMHFSTCASFFISASGVNLTGNTAGVSGGGIGIATYNSGNCKLFSTQPGYHISFLNCNIIDNTAQFGGGVAIQIVHAGIYQMRSSAETKFYFDCCNFKGNKGKFTSAVDINGSSKKLYQTFIILVRFWYCTFANNIADKDIQNSSQKIRGKIFKATMFVIDSTINFVTQVSFLNNIGTALYAINSHVVTSSGADIEFINNTGTKGGACCLFS